MVDGTNVFEMAGTVGWPRAGSVAPKSGKMAAAKIRGKMCNVVRVMVSSLSGA